MPKPASLNRKEKLKILLIFLLFVGCSQRQTPVEQQASFHFEPPPYTRHLKGFKICLDPGHGGQAHVPDYKRGPTGVREAEANLRVALHLHEMLQKVGATVIMTRVDDSYVSLSRRSEIANENGADFFISLHHNGIDNPKVNYTSTWYHGDADDSRQSLDLARYVQQGVSDALQLPTSPASGLYSDKLITTSGFGVLRLTECPAVLCEASFLSNPEEEVRLQKDDYLRREAYGYFLGIARYVEGGFPKGVLVDPQHASVIQTKTPRLQIQVMDGLHERGAWMLKRQQVFTDSIRVKIDNVDVPYSYDRGTDLITVSLDKPLSNGVHLVQTDLVNYYGNHSLPAPQWFKVAPPAVVLDLTAWTDTLPAEGKSYVGISVTTRDSEGMPIADDEPIYAQTSNGTLAADHRLSKDGSAQFYLYAPDAPGTATVEVSYQQTRQSLTIHFANIDGAIVQGQVSDADSGKPIQDVELRTDSGLTTTTDAEGHFFILTGSESKDFGETTLYISVGVGAPNPYYPNKHRIHIRPNQATVVDVGLHPIAEGAFASTVIVLDSKTDTPETQELLTTLEKMLKLAGAKVYNIYTAKSKMPVQKRIEKVNAIKESGYYLQINHAEWDKEQPIVVAAHYRGNQGTETFLKRILEQFNRSLYETPIVTLQDRTTPEIQQTNKMAMTLEIKSLNHPNASTVSEVHAIFFGAWTFLKSDGEIPIERQKRFMAYLKERQASSSN
ncbi:MAG: N-acetylmuramoyl-L-alanine amidase [Candidatus Poribacteria bacterium]|nr:N-acetylmuramoyl-L-alanine amidase [Candidatus Poribacteria bacterium]